MFDHRGSYAAVPLWYVSDVVGLTSGPWRFSSPDQEACENLRRDIRFAFARNFTECTEEQHILGGSDSEL